MKTKIILACIVSLLLFSHAYAEDNSPFSGGIFLGGRGINQSQKSANFNQYNEIAPGLFGGGNLVYDKDKYHFMVDGAYLGEDDYYVKMKGGKWGEYKFSLYFTEFPHNLSFEDRSVFVNPGSQVQGLGTGATATSLRNLSTWPSTSFDYKYTRKDAGGTFDLQMIRPFFFNVDANQLKREGQVPWGANSPGSVSNTTELAKPIDDTTTNVNATFGWKSKQYYAAFSSGYSWYTNGAEYISFVDPFGGGLNRIAGAPDNNSYYLKFTGTAKLPLSSTFSFTGSFQQNKSTTNLSNTYVNIPGVTTSKPSFNGDVEYWNVAANLTSNPWKNLTTKLYFKYLDNKNKSDTIDYINSTTGAFLGSNELFDYQRTTVGAEGAYRFTKTLKGILGYEFSDLQRRSHESELGEVHEDPTTAEAGIPDTWENKWNAQLVWNPLDWLGTRLKYQKLYRGATINMSNPVNPADPASANAVLDNYKQDFYAARKTQDMIKSTLDLTPISNLDVTLEYAFKHDSYDGQTLGYYKAQQHEFIMDGSYDLKGVKFFGFFDYDTTWTDQQTRYVNVTSTPPLPNASPLAAPNQNSFNWRSSLQNNNYAYGAGSSFPIIKDKLSFIVQYDFQKNNGTGDFTSQFLSTNPNSPIALNPNLLNIYPWDDYTMQSISARLKYDVTKQFGLMFGYIYRQFKYNDAQIPAVDPNQTSATILGYRYVMNPAPGTVNTLLSGAYTDQNYNANIFFVRAMYKF
ncbi:MAG TPA: MtrB/PioB family outer membrane beta-barrel protein [Syntrophorhabdales bacterium]|nr:MtrB/PioB family outer membrane beta-barrel protein [Syntrophorhabdales bacterium]